jgi:hypothetical protein
MPGANHREVNPELERLSKVVTEQALTIFTNKKIPLKYYYGELAWPIINEVSVRKLTTNQTDEIDKVIHEVIESKLQAAKNKEALYAARAAKTPIRVQSEDSLTQKIINGVAASQIRALSKVGPAPGQKGIVQVEFIHGDKWNQKPYYHINVATKAITRKASHPSTNESDMNQLENALASIGGRRKTRRAKKSKRRHTRKH